MKYLVPLLVLVGLAGAYAPNLVPQTDQSTDVVIVDVDVGQEAFVSATYGEADLLAGREGSPAITADAREFRELLYGNSRYCMMNADAATRSELATREGGARSSDWNSRPADVKDWSLTLDNSPPYHMLV